MGTVEADQRQRIIDAAREIIRETNDLDLPMRALCSRAKVSMTAPYALFGSKGGVVRAILALNQVDFARQRADLQSTDPLEEHFDSLRIGMDFYASNQSLYRALFRLSTDVAREEEDPTRLNHTVFLARVQAAKSAGLLRSSLDVAAFTEILTDLFSSGVRQWANGRLEIEQLHCRLGYGYATAFAGAGTPQTTMLMCERALQYEAMMATSGTPRAATQNVAEDLPTEAASTRRRRASRK